MTPKTPILRVHLSVVCLAGESSASSGPVGKNKNKLKIIKVKVKVKVIIMIVQDLPNLIKTMSRQFTIYSEHPLLKNSVERKITLKGKKKPHKYDNNDCTGIKTDQNNEQAIHHIQ